MREIKFRGERFDNNKWLKGFLYKYIDHYGKEHYDILSEKDEVIVNYLGGTMPGFIEVKKESIGQFTGLHDKNGKEIYDGDIVAKETFDDTKPNCINTSYAKVMWIEELASYHLVNSKNEILWSLADDKYNIEVAGNIYENSDLLKGVDNIE